MYVIFPSEMINGKVTCTGYQVTGIVKKILKLELNTSQIGKTGICRNISLFGV